ncbi:acyl-CoA dehydrogenase family protein [Amycolatopsis sp.]|uniref:acyl-CoA dehydrogenase family protein n=1 Tax=Amycolatopsis sp. TaxID=37632 RepID=UPI002D7F63A2|nr:acyl-CoA dehydrogenase family protein [Amycolatopsis sp.]HET6705677.1 acyl-CoA dehydrogenase family protein [Amycolatopsis sp.]
MSELLAEQAFLDELVGDRAGAWDVAGELPVELLRKLGAMGILCAEVPVKFGGLGASSLRNGELTAHTGALCSSLRSVMTSQGIAATAVRRFGDRAQRQRYLAELTGGRLAAVGFSEPGAGSDLAAMTTRVRPDGDSVVVTGEKRWVTGSRYADLLLILGRHGDDAAAVVVPADAPGVRVEPVPSPMGCRAAGHARVVLDDVRLPTDAVLGGGRQPLSLLFTTALSYGRMSIAWGCAGIVRACLRAAAAHAREREQAGKPLGEHQLVAGHLADLYVAEEVVTQICRHASALQDAGSPEQAVAAVLAKHVGATHAARAAATAVQVLASWGAGDGHVVARAYRDAKLMEVIEGSNEISRLVLARHVLDNA